MRKQDISVGELVGMVSRQQLQLPEIQRQYVWPATRVRDLLDSLYRGYPSGTILVWETDDPVPTRDLAIEQSRSPFEGQILLLDGQQRLTSLAAVVGGEKVRVRGRRNPIDILFNLDHPEGAPAEAMEVEDDEPGAVGASLGDEEENGEENGDDDQNEVPDLQERLNRLTFVVASRALAQKPNWVSVTEVFGGMSDAELLKRAGVTGFDDPRYGRYVERLTRLRQIRQYMYVMHVLSRDLSYEEVTEIFVRVNSLGVKLRSADLALAQITSRWRSFLNLLEEFQEEAERSWFTLDTGLLVRTMLVFATRQAKFQRASTTTIAELQDGWEKAKRGLRFAINFLRTNAGVEDETVLSAPTLMIPIAVFSVLRDEKLSQEDGEWLLYWLHVANAKGRYTRGSTETLLNEDLATLFRGGAPKDLLEPIRRLFGRLDVLPSDLAGRPARSPLFPLAYLALKARGACDWQSGLGITLAAIGRQHLIQYHHVFPRALLKLAEYPASEINEIANLAFIAGRTNQHLGKRAPEVYFPEIIAARGEDALRRQLIPLDPELHKIANYRAFLEARRVALAEAINEYMRPPASGGADVVQDGY